MEKKYSTSFRKRTALSYFAATIWFLGGLNALESNIEPGQDCGALSLIEFHQQVISEADGPRSHFYPSSSEYMKQAIKEHGVLTGIVLGCDRLMRENSDEGIYPLTELKSGVVLKYDPVPKVSNGVCE